MRRICALLLTAAFGLGVVGCGESAPATKPATPVKPADKDKKPADTKPAETKPADTKPADTK